jgi:hypothetical protein
MAGIAMGGADSAVLTTKVLLTSSSVGWAGEEEGTIFGGQVIVFASESRTPAHARCFDCSPFYGYCDVSLLPVR